MNRIKYVPNPAFTTEVQEQPQHDKGMRSITKTAAKAVRMAARPFRNTGYFERRVRARGQSVVEGDPFWHLSEFGSINNPPQANFRRGLRAVGIRLVMDPKQSR
jgi:hypothetical protein